MYFSNEKKNWKVQTTPVGRPLLPVHYLLCKFMDLRWQSYGKETEKKVIKVPWAVPLNDVTGQGLLPLPCSPRWPLIAKWSFFFFLSLFKAMSGGNNKNKSGIIRRWPRSAVTPVTLKIRLRNRKIDEKFSEFSTVSTIKFLIFVLEKIVRKYF